jgi:metal-responsive CopG/Arc/MetJ family transcriptional regulator
MVAKQTQRRAHIVIPRDLLDKIDEQVGPRKRSKFVQEAVEEKLQRQRLLASITQMAGSLADVDIPGWESSEAAAEWVRALRRGDGETHIAIVDHQAP